MNELILYRCPDQRLGSSGDTTVVNFVLALNGVPLVETADMYIRQGAILGSPEAEWPDNICTLIDALRRALRDIHFSFRDARLETTKTAVRGTGIKLKISKQPHLPRPRT